MRCAPPTHDSDKLIHRLRAPAIAVQVQVQAEQSEAATCGVRGYICIGLPECREPLSLRVSLRLASCGDRGVPAGTCFENEVRQIDACFRPASLMATAPTNSSDSWEVRHVPGVDDASVPCPLISRCEKHSAHICCRHAFLPPSSLLPPFSGACLLSRTDFFEGTGERAWSWLLATLCGLYTHTCTCHVMSNS